VRTPRLFVDSADTAAIAPLLEGALVYGVTTNPTILDRAGRSASQIPSLYESWADQGAREIFFQAWGDDSQSIERRARQILALGERAVVKIVATEQGFQVASRLASQGAPVLLTGVYTVAQALVAASVRMRYIAPYLGRMRDSGSGDLEDIARMQAVALAAGTDVLAASLRSPEDVVALAERGITAFTVSPAVLQRMLSSEATDDANSAFEAAASLVGVHDDLVPIRGTA